MLEEYVQKCKISEVVKRLLVPNPKKMYLFL